MRRREFLKYTAASAVAAPFVRVARADSGVVKVGVVGAKTGPLGPGAAVTHFPPYRLWAHEVNARGGLKLKSGPAKIELIEYDDRTQPPETIKAVERLATVDKADWIGGVFATGFNLAAAPTFAKYGYPQLADSCVTDQAPALIKRYPGLFVFQQSTTTYAKGAIDVLKKLKDGGQIGNKVAVVNVGDDFGIELANVGRPLFKDAGFEIVYDKSYPLGSQDYVPVIKAARSAKPDTFAVLVLPTRHVRSCRTGQDRRPQCEGLFQLRGDGLSGLFAQVWAPRPRMFWVPVAWSIRQKSTTTLSGTKKLPASTLTTGATPSITQCSRFSRNPSKQSALWIVRRLLHISGTVRSELFSANFPCRVRSSTRSTPSGNGRAASSRPCLASLLRLCADKSKDQLGMKIT